MLRVADGSLITVPANFSVTLSQAGLLYLAAESRGRRQAEGEIEHVFFFLAGCF